MILPRRAFLRGLTTLPLIGGAIELIGQPSAVAEPVTLGLMQNYNMWLWHEHHRVGRELDAVYGLPNARFSHVHNAGAAFHCLKDWNFNARFNSGRHRFERSRLRLAGVALIVLENRAKGSLRCKAGSAAPSKRWHYCHHLWTGMRLLICPFFLGSYFDA